MKCTHCGEHLDSISIVRKCKGKAVIDGDGFIVKVHEECRAVGSITEMTCPYCKGDIFHRIKTREDIKLMLNI